MENEFKRDEATVAKARAEGANLTAIQDLKQEQFFENCILEDEILQLESRQLCKEAYRYRVPIPNHSDSELWKESNSIGGRQLTTKGFALLISDLRKEKNDRWQYWEARTKVIIPLASALTGLFGVLIGWAAFWK